MLQVDGSHRQVPTQLRIATNQQRVESLKTLAKSSTHSVNHGYPRRDSNQNFFESHATVETHKTYCGNGPERGTYCGIVIMSVECPMEDSSFWQITSRIPVILITLLVCACNVTVKDDSGNYTPPFKPVASIHELMHDVVYPNADIVWKSVGTIISYEGTNEIRPENEGEWEVVERSALTLTEVGNLLMMDGRAKNKDDWMERATALIEASTIALEAARNRDEQAIFDSGEGIYFACSACHLEYYYEDDPSIIR